jgi:hypothetical protein
VFIVASCECYSCVSQCVIDSLLWDERLPDALTRTSTMGFLKGHKKVGGRKKGSLNKATRLGRQLAQAILTDEKYQDHLRRRMTHDQPPPEIEKMLWAYGCGQPLDPNVRRSSTPRRPPEDGEA